MIKEEKAISQNAIENIICKPIDELKRFPMDEETTKTFFGIYMLPKEFSIAEKEKPFLYKVIERRIEHCFSFKITDARLILVLAMIAETPGSAIMYLWYLQYWCKKKNVKELSLDSFCEDVFPMGFPSKDDLHRLWDAQKVSEDGRTYNLVDHSEYGISIQFMQPAITT